MSNTPNSDNENDLLRWRLILGRFAENTLGGCGGGGQQNKQGGGGSRSRYGKMDRVLDYLYGREYSGRGVRGQGNGKDGQGNRGDGRGGGQEESVLTVPEWLQEVRELFPNDTVDIIQRHALDRYGMTELVTDPEVLGKMEPSYELLKAILTFKGMMKGEVLEIARKIVRQVVEDLRRKLAKEVRQALWGRLNKQRRSRLKVLRNLDWQRTIKSNLKNYSPERKQLVLGALHFFSRVDHHMPWHIIMAVDCSGSMMDSVIYSAVMAGIFKGLPTVRVSLTAFDTAIVDLSDQIDDPTELLMSVQLGGGTNIGGALEYCETLVRTPTRTIVVLVTDFFEGYDPRNMLASIKRLCEAGVRVIGLAALDAVAQPSYDRGMAEQCVAAGAHVAALTPQRLAQWLGTILS
ncbi:VWA domain-containing protein [Anatilimnocola floriformis]|uniref:VWA domain-containing protein n=1 Tax=Anatilimnocola floriformis TaxID=2948575 RepID=UPI0020C1C671|nr:VWA domain-containing protein [Anatilimnocola floriformis]